jgi:hypothetical protein
MAWCFGRHRSSDIISDQIKEPEMHVACSTYGVYKYIQKNWLNSIICSQIHYTSLSISESFRDLGGEGGLLPAS